MQGWRQHHAGLESAPCRVPSACAAHRVQTLTVAGVAGRAVKPSSTAAAPVAVDSGDVLAALSSASEVTLAARLLRLLLRLAEVRLDDEVTRL